MARIKSHGPPTLAVLPVQHFSFPFLLLRFGGPLSTYTLYLLLSAVPMSLNSSHLPHSELRFQRTQAMRSLEVMILAHFTI